MTTPADSGRLLEAMAPLVRPLYAALDKADELAGAYFASHGMDSSAFNPCRRHLARAHAYRLLNVEATTGGMGKWRVAKPGPNVSVTLHHESLAMKLLRPAPGETVPPPGSNASRRAYYSKGHDNLLGVLGSSLIGVWFEGTDESGSTLRVVRPVGKWSLGLVEQIDIDFYLPRVADDLEELTFEVTDDTEVNLPFASEDQNPDEDEGASDAQP